MRTLIVFLVVTAAQVTSEAVCPSRGSPLVDVMSPVLTTACPSGCPSFSMCTFYPSTSASQCSPTPKRPCVFGDANTCAFQCLSDMDVGNVWTLTLYTKNAVADAVREKNGRSVVVDPAIRPSVAINVSDMKQWVGAVTLPSKVTLLEIAGNEPASNSLRLSDGYDLETQSLDASEVIPFEFPESFFSDIGQIQWLRLENVRLPTLTRDAKKLASPVLERLYLRNTLLKSIPVTNVSTPSLTILDLSGNSISEVRAGAIPSSVKTMNLSANAISRVEKDSLPASLTQLDISANAIEEVPGGTLPLGFTSLSIASNPLTGVPTDISKMAGLRKLWLSNTHLQDMSDTALPLQSIEELHADNCSLTSIPKAFKSMTSITRLSMMNNDLSRDPDFSMLPDSVQSLVIDKCRLQGLPQALRNLTKLNSLSLGGNPGALSDLSALPRNLQELSMLDSQLETIPAGLVNASIHTLLLDKNPLGQLKKSSLPSQLTFLSISNATFREIRDGTLPSTLNVLNISNSALQQVPSDVRGMPKLSVMTLSNCQLSSVDHKIPSSISQLDLSGNRITRFSGRFPSLVHLDLRNNQLSELELIDTSIVTTLHLADNNLTSIPEAVFQPPKLKLLNMVRNPIRNLTLTENQRVFLSRISISFFDKEMFARDCDPAQRTSFGDYFVCLSTTSLAGETNEPLNKNVWMWLVPVVVTLVLGLALIARFVRRRRVMQNSQSDLDKHLLPTAEVSRWTDTILLRNQLEGELIDRKYLLYSSQRTHVWLAMYKNDAFALKQPNQSAEAMSHQHVDAFVDEIKLMSSLTHPCVIELVGVVWWTKDSDIAMLTEYMEGGDLRSFLDKNAKTNMGWTSAMIQIALHISEAIVYLHSLDPVLIHRDLTTRNVLLDSQLRAKLTDFGNARHKSEHDDSDLTMSLRVSSRWTAPEMLTGERYNESVDIYSLGVILSEMDTHEHPVQHEDQGGCSSHGLRARPLFELVAPSLSCPHKIRSLIERATSRDPTQRPSGLHIAFELRALLKHAASSSDTDSGSTVCVSEIAGGVSG